MAVSYLCIDILKISQPVLAVLGIADVILGHQLITAGGEQNAIHEVGNCARAVLLVSPVPVGRNIIGCVP